MNELTQFWWYRILKMFWVAVLVTSIALCFLLGESEIGYLYQGYNGIWTAEGDTSSAVEIILIGPLVIFLVLSLMREMFFYGYQGEWSWRRILPTRKKLFYVIYILLLISSSSFADFHDNNLENRALDLNSQRFR